MLYYNLFFGLFFLPITILIYQLLPKRFRWVILLIASLGFYCTNVFASLAVYLVIATAITYPAGLLLDKMNRDRKAALKNVSLDTASGTGKTDKSEKSKQADQSDKDKIKELKNAIKAKYQRRSRFILVAGILLSLSFLLYLKYYNFLMNYMYL